MYNKNTMTALPCSDGADEIYDVRCVGPSYQPEFFSKNMRRFVDGSKLSPKMKEDFFASQFFCRSLARSQLGGASVFPDDRLVHKDDVHYKIRKWRYLNGTYIGITQIIDYFSTTQICEFERDAKTVLRYAESTKFWLPKFSDMI